MVNGVAFDRSLPISKGAANKLPQRQMRDLFGRLQRVHEQHIGIVPVARFGVFALPGLAETDIGHAAIRWADVAGRAPQIAVNLGRPIWATSAMPY